MINVRAELGDGRTSIVVDGHENHAEGGRVCAAVTAITQAALLGLSAYAELYPDIVSIQITENP